MPATKNLQWFTWKPDPDTGVAILTALVWIGVYFILTHVDDPPLSTVYYIAALLAGVLFPLWWLCCYRGRPLAGMWRDERAAGSGEADGRGTGT